MMLLQCLYWCGCLALVLLQDVDDVEDDDDTSNGGGGGGGGGGQGSVDGGVL